MFGFFRKRSAGHRDILLTAVPVKNELVRAVAWGPGLRLKAPLRSTALRRIFGGGTAPGAAEKGFELDELGAWVWEQLNGKRTVERLIGDFAGHFRVNLREAEVSVLTFLKTLTQRNLIGLVAPAKHRQR